MENNEDFQMDVDDGGGLTGFTEEDAQPTDRNVDQLKESNSSNNAEGSQNSFSQSAEIIASAIIPGPQSNTNKLIRKRQILLPNSPHPDDDNDDHDDGKDTSSRHKSPHSEAAEKIAARRELVEFLARNGIDEKAADAYKISLRPIKSRSRSQSFPDKKEEIKYGVSYISPNDLLLDSKHDVLRDIQENRSRRMGGNKFHSRGGSYISREEAHEQAKENLREKTLPIDVNGIKIINFGKVDTRSGFHSCVQLYPVGYKCEQTVSGMTLHKGVFQQNVICEIKEVDGFPQFFITSKNTKTVVIGTSEESAWKQFYPGNIDTDSKLSFFNLEIELLLEGLAGSLECEEYKFHCERGYGKDYTKNKDAIAAKAAFVKKMDRERRISDRQRSRTLTKEEQDRLAELQRRKEEEDKKFAKDQAAILKQRKDVEKEEYKKNREREKIEEAEKKEQQKKKEQEKKEAEKAEERAKKEENKRESKARQNYKKDIISDLKKARSEVTSAVMQAFDEEEKENEVPSPLITDADIELLPSNEYGNSSLHSSTLEEFLYKELRPLPELATIDENASDIGSESCWNDFFAVANYIHLFKSLLDVEQVTTLQTLLQSLSGKVDEKTSALFSPASTNQDVRSMESVDADLGFGDISTRAQHNEENFSQNNGLEAFLERVQLNILKVLLPSINAKLDLDQKDNVDANKRDKRQQAPSARLPLNQLTWNEMVRMTLIQYLFTEMNRSKDDLQHAIRGSKAGNFRFAKNICRNIRYKWFIRNTVSSNSAIASHNGMNLGGDSEDRIPFVKSMQGPTTFDGMLTSVEGDYETNQRRNKLRPCEYTFTSAEELIDAITKISDCSTYPEIYRRCAKVLLRIVKMPSAQQFLWEIDQESPSYYSTIVRPVMFANIANSLINRVYDETDQGDDDLMTTDDALSIDDEQRIAKEFYADMKQVILNCFTYNTELAPVVSSAQKLLHAIYRHVDRWIVAADRPPVDCCDDKCCILSQQRIIHQKTVSIKCGKCAAAFNLESVERIFLSDEEIPDQYKPYSDFFIAPTDELVNQANEEWHCPLCLKEDFILLKAMATSDISKTIDQLTMSRSSFFVDEWGPSAAIPWIFNPIHSQILKQFEKRESYLLPIVEALKIVSNHQLSCMGNDAFGIRRSWSVGERLKVLKALFVILQSTESGLKLISKLNDDGDKLMKYCSKASFREAEFVSYVKEICGDSGVIFSRKLLDGFDFANSDGGPRIDYNSQTCIEGRCMLCNGSTFNEEQSDDESDSKNGDESNNQAILCDGCNGEAHLRCLGMTTVPKVSWYCSTCSIRQSHREKKSDVIQLDNIDQHRGKEEEEELIWKCVERKVKGKDIFRETECEGQIPCCSYCGLHEISICSPFVYGQSKSEHDHWVQLTNKVPFANNVLDEHSSTTTVNFLHNGVKIPGPKVDYPYFPLIDSRDGQELKKRYEASGSTPIIVHQMCALHMFQTRVNRSKYEFRKRRKEIGKLIENMGGAFLFPLGNDTFGNEYWHFPYSDDLFIVCRSHKAVDPDRVEFRRILTASSSSSSAATSPSTVAAAEPFHHNTKERWIRVVETDHIRKLIKLLDIQASTDFSNAKALQALKVNIINSVLAKRLVAYDLARTVQQDAAAVKDENQSNHTGSDHQVSNEGATSVAATAMNNNVPVEMKLNTNKGADLPSHIFIESEDVVDVNALDDDDKDKTIEDIFAPYFSLSTRKYYAIALVNANGTMVKMKQARGNDKRTVIYQVRREGYPSHTLVEAELSDAWDDHIYYFSSLVFKKSGTYTISFIVQNSVNSVPIKPMVFKVVVSAKSYSCGVSAALNHLRAQAFIHAEHRQIYQSRRELLQLAKSAIDEFSAVKASLIFMYLALPNGSLGSEANLNVSSRGVPHGKNSKAVRGSILFEGLLEPTGWNSILEQTWTGVVINATTPMELMECLLVLEFYLSRSVFGHAQSKLWSALPNPHFAIRCATFSAVAMRVFCLDRVLLYNKAQVPSREKRGSSSRAITAPDLTNHYIANQPTSSKGRSSTLANQRGRKIAPRPNYKEDDDDDEEEEEDEEDSEDDDDDQESEDGDDNDDGYNGRRSSKRSSARATSRGRKSYREESEDEFFEEDQQPRRSSRAVTKKNYGEISDDDNAMEESHSAAPTSSSARKTQKRKQLESDDEEVDFDDGGVKPVTKRTAVSETVSPDIKKPKLPPPIKKSFEQIQTDYINALPGAVRKFSVDIAEFANNHPELSPGVIDTNMRFLSVLRRFKQIERTLLFWDPVDRSVVGYHDIIKQPMDLGTITYRVRNNEYNGDIALFMKDMNLVWSNCKTFNLAGSILYQYAIEFEQLTARLIEEWILSKRRPENPDIREDV